MATSKITAFKCDRCGEREDVPEVSGVSHDWRKIRTDSYRAEEDLCPKCWESFKAWMRQPIVEYAMSEDGVMAGTIYGPKMVL